MVSFPPRERLPALCLILVGVTLCASGIFWIGPTNGYSVDQTETAVASFAELPADAQRIVEEGSGSGPVTVEDVPDEFSPNSATLVRHGDNSFCVYTEENSGANQTVSVRDCTDVTFDFERLSPRGKAIVSVTLDSPNNEITLNQDVPQEFSAGPGDSGDFYPPQGNNRVENGNYYIIKNDTVYHFTIQGPGGLAFGSTILFGLFVISGLALTLYGLVSYARSKVYTPLMLLAGVSVYALPPLLSLVRLHQQSLWLNTQPSHLIAVVLFFLSGLSVAFYEEYQQNEEA
ncbi:hypothetical protein [Salinibaculum salinum]|uniref:hypothetical protein n=1 Tax=Salinibaculum salinum TaxID=3131996 RepID=UPI0030EC9234